MGMRRVRLENLAEGEVLAQALYGEDGKILLNAGVVLKKSYIRRLRAMGLPVVYVADGTLPDVDVPDVLRPEVRAALVRDVKTIFDRAARDGELDVRGVSEAVNRILDEITSNGEVVIHLSDLRTYDSYTFAHCVNVCAVSLLLGRQLGLNDLQLRELGVGTLLHDIGKTLVPAAILNKPGRLTPEEYDLVKQHPTHGFNILRKNQEIPLLAAHVAYQHHELMNGRGYPRGLTDSQIHLYARLTTVADVFDAMRAERVYHRAVPTHLVLRHLKERAGTLYDAEAVSGLLKQVAPYPISARVRLDSGEIGIVVSVRREDLERPVVRLLLDRNGKPVGQFAEIDLVREQDRYVAEVLPD